MKCLAEYGWTAEELGGVLVRATEERVRSERVKGSSRAQIRERGGNEEGKSGGERESGGEGKSREEKK